jgi:hypothetical protein
VITPLQPQVMEFWRFDSPRSLREPMRRFLNEAELAGQVRRVWYESDQVVEIVAEESKFNNKILLPLKLVVTRKDH